MSILKLKKIQDPSLLNRFFSNNNNINTNFFINPHIDSNYEEMNVDTKIHMHIVDGLQQKEHYMIIPKHSVMFTQANKKAQTKTFPAECSHTLLNSC